MQSPVAIIAAMPEELSAVLNRVRNPQEKKLGNTHFWTGTLSGYPIVLTCSGIGKVNAAHTTTLIIQSFLPIAIINTGSAGALDKTVNIGDVVISRSVAHHDVNVSAFGYQIGQIPQMPPFFSATAKLISLTNDAVQVNNVKVHHGLIVSGDQFVTNPTQLSVIFKHFPGVLACDMEAAAIAQVAYISSVDWVIVRAISDKADNSAQINFKEFLKTASVRSAEMVAHILDSIAQNGYPPDSTC